LNEEIENKPKPNIKESINKMIMIIKMMVQSIHIDKIDLDNGVVHTAVSWI
jgi:hypothetical protein